jgi:hypothetical protein
MQKDEIRITNERIDKVKQVLKSIVELLSGNNEEALKFIAYI